MTAMEDLEKFTPSANGAGGTITTGVNIADLAAADAILSESATTNEPSGSGGGGDAMHPAPILSPAFHVYWDDSARSYKVNNPKIIDPAGNDVDVDGSQSFADGDIFCEVKFNKSGGTYSAKLTTSLSQAEDVIAAVPIATIAATGVTQYHVGVIVIAGTYITGESGTTEGSTAVTVHGNVKAQGDTGSGLKCKTWELGSQKYLSIDLSGRTAQQSFGIHDITNSDGEATGVKIFSTGDVKVGDEEEEEDEPGSDPDEPYEDPEDTFPDDEEAINGDGNDISNDAGSLDDGNGDYCNSIFGGGGGGGGGGNEISNTCSK